MDTSCAHPLKPGHKNPVQPGAKHLAPSDILLEQAQICCREAREAARLSRRQAAQGLLCTARDLLHRAAGARPAEDSTPARLAASARTPAPRAPHKPQPCDYWTLRLKAADDRGRDALLRALELQTGSLWRWAGDILAVEQEAPHRVVALRGQALRNWRDWSGQGSRPECELGVEVFAPMNARH